MIRVPRRTSKILLASAAVLALTVPSQAYYHYVHYLSSGGPYNQIPEAFNLATLPNKTLTFLVSDTGTWSAIRPQRQLRLRRQPD